MMHTKSTETILTGQWTLQNGRLIADEVCERIAALTKYHLVEIRRDASGWNTLYRDPDDGRYWELLYPNSELHGGGPPQLRYLTVDQAKEKYDIY